MLKNIFDNNIAANNAAWTTGTEAYRIYYSPSILYYDSYISDNHKTKKHTDINQFIAPISKFLKLTIGLNLASHARNKSKIKKQWIAKSWSLLAFLVTLQSGLYVFFQLAMMSTLVSSLKPSLKGVRFQMSQFAAFLAHTNSSIIGLIVHSLLILTIPGTIQKLLASLAPICQPF